ncbi:uncharacterized protein LOC132298627 [Cornus florida]|uniref:uncharacterized protein LOC132298627 n=1 Tax=Cornus florida TaxID=4283 RepID=UPI002896A2F5|nr:uncharacterized protein LOC132298627 [Cornus florida]
MRIVFQMMNWKRLALRHQAMMRTKVMLRSSQGLRGSAFGVRNSREPLRDAKKLLGHCYLLQVMISIVMVKIIMSKMNHQMFDEMPLWNQRLSDNGGKPIAFTNQNKLKQRRMAKRLARERSKKSSNMKNYHQDRQPSSGNEDYSKF